MGNRSGSSLKGARKTTRIGRRKLHKSDFRRGTLHFMGVMSIAAVLFGGVFFALSAEPASKKLTLHFTDQEKKAVRIEMIEMDITIRTIVSMISLNKPDRLEVQFSKLAKLHLEDSVYHKKSISAAVNKWKQTGLIKYIDAIQTEASAISGYLAKQIADEAKNTMDWELVYQANKKILENCRACHVLVGIDRQ